MNAVEPRPLVLVTVARVPRPNVAQPVRIQEGATVALLLRQLQIPPDAVLVVRGDEPLPLDAPVREGDALRVIQVFSGG